MKKDILYPYTSLFIQANANQYFCGGFFFGVLKVSLDNRQNMERERKKMEN